MCTLQAWQAGSRQWGSTAQPHCLRPLLQQRVLPSGIDDTFGPWVNEVVERRIQGAPQVQNAPLQPHQCYIFRWKTPVMLQSSCPGHIINEKTPEPLLAVASLWSCYYRILCHPMTSQYWCTKKCTPGHSSLQLLHSCEGWQGWSGPMGPRR